MQGCCDNAVDTYVLFDSNQANAPPPVCTPPGTTSGMLTSTPYLPPPPSPPPSSPSSAPSSSTLAAPTPSNSITPPSHTSAPQLPSPSLSPSSSPTKSNNFNNIDTLDSPTSTFASPPPGTTLPVTSPPSSAEPLVPVSSPPPPPSSLCKSTQYSLPSLVISISFLFAPHSTSTKTNRTVPFFGNKYTSSTSNINLYSTIRSQFFTFISCYTNR